MESSRQEAQASSSNRSCDHVHGGGDRRNFDRSAELMSVDQRDSKLFEAPIAVAGGFGGGASSPAVEVKRKRGRPPRGTTPVTAVEEEEDVCFICFDGGSLVLCDRRNCPKAYHPACIKRDESFFRSRAKWNCGWHICSTCMKASHYLCYTCTFSSCKGCINNADYVCVRGNKGFCGTCKRTILLIENYEGNKEGPQVDFDDKTSWEYLFKVYWVLLKGNLSLTLDELLKARNPWNPPQVSASNWGFSGGLNGGIRNGSTISGNSVPDLEVLNAKRRKINTKTNVLVMGNSLGIEKDGGDTITHRNGDANWASKELLEFVAHMRNGDASVMSQFDVQNLVLDYIRVNNLHDPVQKCEIVCDSRLSNMFGQARLGHIEMLKLLESHFLIKDDYMVSSMEGIGVAEAVGSQMESTGDYNSQMTTVNDNKRKLRGRPEKGSPTNPDAYAKIDVNNIKLIYLRRCLLETLLDNAENFHEKVVGSIVRIRVSCSDQKPDMHRLVRVVGTSKGAEPYKLGTRDTNLMLDILNLDKKEVMAIHRISNQEFSQEECERLRQSIKFGLIKRLTVGEIQEKAIALQEVKINDWIEAEKLRLNDLRNRASEKGHRKELRECTEKLERLNSPDERKRMLEVPIVHSDPSMDPSYDFDHKPSELHQNKQVSDYQAKPRNSGVGRRKRESTPAEKKRESKTSGMKDLNTPKQEADSTDSGTEQSVNDWELYKIWHYQDPTGKIQGPFFMAQLRKWSISGHFPPHLRVWRLNEKPEDSILLTDILDGLCSKDQLSEINVNMPQQEQEASTVSDEEKNNDNADGSGENECVDINQGNGQSVGRSVNLDLNDQIKNFDDSNEAINTDGLGSNPSSSTAAVFANPSDGNSTNLPVDLDSLFDEVLPTQQSRVSTSQSTLDLLGKQTPLHEANEDRESERNSDRSENVWQNTDSETRNNQGSENRSDGEAQSGQSSGQSWRQPLSSSSPVNKDSKTLPKSLEMSDQTQTGVDLSTPPTTTLEPSNKNEIPEGKAKKINNKQSDSPSIVPVQEHGLSWSTTSSLVAGYCPSLATKTSVEEWDPSLVAAEIAGEHVKTPASISDHLTPSSPSHPHSNSSSWIPDPDEFSSLLNESVSDLLAEVEAMESLHALSCHNVVNSGGPAELPKADCISPVIEGFSPAPEPGKGDALSSTAEVHLPVSQSNFVDELFGVGSDRSPEAYPPISPEAYPPISPETEGDAKHSEVSVDQWDGSSGIPPAAAASWDVEISETPWNADWGAVANGVMDWNPPPPPPPPPPVAPVIAVAPPPPPPAPAPAPAPPSGGILGSQPRHGSGRYSPRDRAYHGKDSGFGRNRNAWNSNRQPYFAGGGAPIRAPAKGQRVCKFYESGYCKRGSSCSFFHP